MYGGHGYGGQVLGMDEGLKRQIIGELFGTTGAFPGGVGGGNVIGGDVGSGLRAILGADAPQSTALVPTAAPSQHWTVGQHLWAIAQSPVVPWVVAGALAFMLLAKKSR